MGLLEYKSVVTLEDEQSESVQNGRTLRKSVDLVAIRLMLFGNFHINNQGTFEYRPDHHMTLHDITPKAATDHGCLTVLPLTTVGWRGDYPPN